MKLLCISILVTVVCHLPVRASDYVAHLFTPEIEISVPPPPGSTIVKLELNIEHAAPFVTLKTPEGQHLDQVASWRTESTQAIALHFRDGLTSLKSLTGNLQLLQEIRNVEESFDQDIPCRLIATGHVYVRLPNGRLSQEKLPVRVSFVRMRDLAERK